MCAPAGLWDCAPCTGAPSGDWPSRCPTRCGYRPEKLGESTCHQIPQVSCGQHRPPRPHDRHGVRDGRRPVQVATDAKQPRDSLTKHERRQKSHGWPVAPCWSGRDTKVTPRHGSQKSIMASRRFDTWPKAATTVRAPGVTPHTDKVWAHLPDSDPGCTGLTSQTPRCPGGVAAVTAMSGGKLPSPACTVGQRDGARTYLRWLAQCEVDYRIRFGNWRDCFVPGFRVAWHILQITLNASCCVWHCGQIIFAPATDISTRARRDVVGSSDFSLQRPRRRIL